MNVQRGLITTRDEAKLHDMVEAQNGIITSTQVTEAGIPRRCLSSMVQRGLLVRVARGVYTLPDTWEDELCIVQYQFSEGDFFP